MKVFLVVIAFCISSASALTLTGIANAIYTYKQLHKEPNDSGKMVNCGASQGGSDFTLTWTPAVISANKKYVISMTGKASTSFSTGKANVTIMVGQTPVISQEIQVSCDEVKPYTQGQIKCPVKPGDKISLPSFGIQAPAEVSKVPPGTYTISVWLTNETGKLFVCAKGDVTFGG